VKSEIISEKNTAVGVLDEHSANRKLFLRDSVAFVVLFLVTVVLYVATSFLFRSFSDRREELAKEFSIRGKQALKANDPEAAILALRTSLEYSPSGRDEHLLLAEALAEGHHRAEAIDYFLNLRDTEPASGFVNLELARLYREEGDSAKAIDDYRAASLGNWDSDGMEQRSHVELELSQYLIERGNLGAARAELMVAAQNAPESADTEVLLGDKLLQANDRAGALASYQRAIALNPHQTDALAKAGRMLYDMGNYAEARRLLDLAVSANPKAEQAQSLSELSDNAAGLLRLSLSTSLPGDERAEHLRADAKIAKHRLDSCLATLHGAPFPAPLQDLKSQWQTVKLRSLSNGEGAAELIFDTENTTAQVCGAPAGDDALLLLLLKTPVSGAQEKR
jgi:tetratricopeptide (TPR) repeat protein